MHLHEGLMLQSQIWGRGLGGYVLWVTLSRLDVGANTVIVIFPQPLHAFKPDQA